MSQPKVRRSIYIIHGRNAGALKATSEFIRVLGFTPKTYQDQRGQSKHGAPSNQALFSRGIKDCAAVVGMFTPDERSSLRRELRLPHERARGARQLPWQKLQARPNVIFETGFAFGTSALARKTVIVALGADVSYLSDIDGLDIIHMSDDDGPALLATRLYQLLGFRNAKKLGLGLRGYTGFKAVLDDLSSTDEDRFNMFFFGDASPGDVFLVHAARRARAGQRAVVFDVEPAVNRKRRLDIPKDAVPEGVVHWLSVEDIRAAVALSNMFAFYGLNVKMALPGDMLQDFNGCAVSLGLGFNEFTHVLAQRCRHCLFSIGWGKSLTGKRIKTDQIQLGPAATVLDTILEQPLDPTQDYAIVARIVSKRANGSVGAEFVCAGRTAAGTAAAGNFLARSWTKIYELYGKAGRQLDRDSVVVVLRHTIGGQNHDASGRMDQKLTHWWCDDSEDC